MLLTALINVGYRDAIFAWPNGLVSQYDELVRLNTRRDPQWTADFLRWLRTETPMRYPALVGTAAFVSERLASGQHGMSRQVVNSVLRRADDVAVRFGYSDASQLLAQLTEDWLRASMAAPVHDSGSVTGSLLVGSYRSDRTYTPAELQTLRAFAQHVSLALNDANTVERMFQAFHDSLTGLANRGLFLDRLTQQLQSHESERIALLFIDLDRFKAVNDTLGHAAGDALLKTTAERLKSNLRTPDMAARFGGDEFAIMLCRAPRTAEAVRIAERIRLALSEPMVIAGRRLEVNASVGIALSTRGLSDPMELMRRADVAMYQAKRRGRGRCGVFTDEMLVAFPAD